MKIDQRHGNKEQGDSAQKGERSGIMGEGRGRVRSRNMYKGPMEKDNSEED